ncbi:CoA-transferase family III [Myriangium duriaei CBS 260.36]|uniref:CoA-transferase family III n=1 Tax=Myriangium duriaei CBS 260.36 TaxID=1168546 RepID=A0A9P4IWT4_9PEZI|nr:CoA-transferase family III [Myriangium duriaei CBS 260.36]
MTEDISNKLLAQGPNDLTQYSVPDQTRKVLEDGILGNASIVQHLPLEANKYAKIIRFDGSDLPSLPINWRFAESISSLKALEAIMLSALLKRKYDIVPKEIVINTDHAQLFIMSALLWTLDPLGENVTPMSTLTPEGKSKFSSYFPDCDLHHSTSSIYKYAVTNIYKTKDGRFFHLHGSMDPRPSLRSLGLPEENKDADLSLSCRIIGDAVANLTAESLQDLATNKFKQAGTICYSTDEYKSSDHGRANAHVGLWDMHYHPNPTQKPFWWTDCAMTSPRRPLGGLKVLDLTRVIAAPAIARGLAEYGASVLRVTSNDVTDMSLLHPDLNHGKWNCNLDLKKETDRDILHELILEADVILQGYRPGVLEKYGLSEKDLLNLCGKREYGIVYARENCYGWAGPWQERSGWQQISDANCGVSLEFGRAMGNDEPVTPVFPNSDYCTGVAGVAGILAALMQRAEKGGSYTVDIALNYYSQWLVDSVGTYPSLIWNDVWARNGSPVFRHYDNMQVLLPAVLKQIITNSSQKLMRPEFFTQYPIKNMDDLIIKHPAPIIRFPNREIEPGFHVGTRGNGVDAPHWPSDLSVEVVSKHDG